MLNILIGNWKINSGGRQKEKQNLIYENVNRDLFVKLQAIEIEKKKI